ncbi:MAG: PIN domain-containing protein [Nanoarchaeota archaeon]
MTYTYLIDSSAWIEYLGGTNKGAKIRHIIEEEEVCCSIIAIAEIADAYDREQRPCEDRLIFIKQKAVIVPINFEIARKSAVLKHMHRKNHPKFSLADGIHLATAQVHQATLVTTDHDFEGLPQVMLIV